MINYATIDVHMKAFELLHSVGLISICILAFGMIVSLVVSTYLFGMNVWNSSWIPFNPSTGIVLSLCFLSAQFGFLSM